MIVKKKQIHFIYPFKQIPYIVCMFGLIQIPILFVHIIFIMQSCMKVCNKLNLKSEKDYEAFKKREEFYINGTPRLVIGKANNLYQQIWTDDLRHESLSILKDQNSNKKAFGYAHRVIQACVGLAGVYGYFILNQNMIFFNQQKEIFTWINPDILQNKVKIYLPPTASGQQAMIRSIIIFLKLWLRCDFALLNQVKRLSEFIQFLQPIQVKPYAHFKTKLEESQEITRQCSVNLHEAKFLKRKLQDSIRFTEDFPQKLKNQSIREGKFKHPTSRGSQSTQFTKQRFSFQFKPQFKIFTRNPNEQPRKTVTQFAEKKEEFNSGFEHKTFTNVNNILHSKTCFNKSLGMKSYFPNKTTSSKNHIVKMILEHDDDPNNFPKNNILLDQERLRELEEQTRKNMKISVNGVIGEQLNDLFQSGISEEQNSSNQMLESYIKNQFNSVLE